MQEGPFDTGSEQPIPTAPSGPTSDERLWGMLAHLAAFLGFIGIPLGNILGPLVIWLVKRDESSFVGAHAKESLNFQITLTLAGIALVVGGGFIGALTCGVGFFLGVILFAVLAVYAIVVQIMAAIEANNGRPYRYAFCIRFIN